MSPPLLTLFVGLVAMILVRRRIDPVTAYAAVWSVSVGGTLTGIIHYDPLPVTAVLIVAWVTLALLGGYTLGSTLAVDLPRLRGIGGDVWEALGGRRYLPVALALLAKSVLILLLQARAGAFGGGPEGPAVVRGMERSLLTVYLTYMSLGDLIMAPIGGALIQRKGQLLRGLLPVVSLFLVSMSLGGRTYIFWGATGALAGFLFSHRPGNVLQAVRKVLLLVVLGLVFGLVVESIRFMRSGGLPYATSLTRILPFSDFVGNEFSILDSLVAVALYYWTSALAAFGEYATALQNVEIRPFGWAVRGIMNVYAIDQLREIVYVPVPTNVYTWLPYFYEDLGWLGYMVYPIALGGIAGFAFRQLRDTGSNKYLVLSSLVTTVFVFSPFDFALGNKAMYLAFLLAILL